MGKYTLDTDFSSLSGSQTQDWMLGFRDMVEEAFRDSDDRHRLLGNLLIMEQYIHTVRQGLENNDEQLSNIMQRVMDLLWDYLEGRTSPTDFQDLANNLYACILAYNTGEDLTDEQNEFYCEHFEDATQCTVEYSALEWGSVLLLELVAITGARLDFDSFETCKQIDFYGIEEMLNLLEDASIEFTNTPCPSNMVSDLMKAEEEVRQTPLFQQIIKHVQNSLKTALAATPDQFLSLREEFKQYTIISEEYAADLLEY